MTTIEETSLARLQSEGRFLNTAVEQESQVAGRFLYRGEIAIKFATLTEKEKKPPELKAEQVIISAHAGEPSFRFFACYLLSFEFLAPLVDVLGPALGPNGKYFAYCSNIDLAAKYTVRFGEATFYVLPLDETTVFNEMVDLLRLDVDALKKKNATAKLDALADGSTKVKGNFEPITYEQGLELMGPVKDPGENRPV